MAIFPKVEEIAEQVKEAVLNSIMIDDVPIGKLIENGDLARVVRCKNCKHYSGKPCGRVDFWNTDDDFCSRGER